MEECIMVDVTPHRDLIDYFQALLTPVVAILGIYIAWRQWRTAQNRLKLDFFDRRWAVYEATRNLLGTVTRSGTATHENVRDFVVGTGPARWLFDDELADYLEKEIRQKAVNLMTLDDTLRQVTEPAERQHYVREKGKNSVGLVEQYEQIDRKFGAFLHITH